MRTKSFGHPVARTKPDDEVGPGLEFATFIIVAIVFMFLLVQAFCMFQTYRPGGIFSTPSQPQGGVRPTSDPGVTPV